MSSQTLPGYFENDSLSDIMLNADTDLELFASIAQELEIEIRFTGEEPLDVFIRQYNDATARALPLYGIDFREIRRMEVDGAVVGASRVREAIAKGDNATVKSIVPDVTYSYLVDNGWLETK